MTRNHSFSVDEFYHVYNRGVDKRSIFSGTGDKERFLRIIFLSNGSKSYVVRDIDKGKVYQSDRGEELVAVCAYSLMDNHYHFLLRELSEGGISKFMLKLATAYTMYFNIKYARTGVLFQGTFRSKHVDQDEYLRHLATYIHMNALDMHQASWKQSGISNKKIAIDFLESYKYHSLPDHVGVDRTEGVLLNKDHFPVYYKKSEDMLSDIDDWMDIVPEIEKSLF
ncbi:MAG TPA: transposase [Candidatus Paceibacterota bacterium]